LTLSRNGASYAERCQAAAKLSKSKETLYNGCIALIARRESEAVARMTAIIILIALILAAGIIGILWVFVFQPKAGVPIPGDRATLPGGEFEIGRELGDAYFG